MALLSPQPNAWVGGITKLDFDQPIQDLSIQINGMHYHARESSGTYRIDLNPFEPDRPIDIELHYKAATGESLSDRICVVKPRHDRGGMGPTVIRDEQNNNLAKNNQGRLARVRIFAPILRRRLRFGSCRSRWVDNRRWLVAVARGFSLCRIS